jgi:hypothetical protein
MINRKQCLATLLLGVAVSIALPALAAEQLAYQQKVIKKVRSGARSYVTCASVNFTPPQDGAVVVTASGMAVFDAAFSDLTLSLKTAPASKGPWVYSLTPGEGLLQGYTVRYVFSVTGNKPYTFYLNGTSANGPGKNILVETGSITAEFYSNSDVQAGATRAAAAASGAADGRSNAP